MVKLLVAVNKEKAALADERDFLVLTVTLLADQNNSLGLEVAAQEVAAREQEAAQEESAAPLTEVTELDLWDSAWRGEEAREDCDRRRSEAEEGATVTLAQFRAEEALTEVAGAAAAELAVAEQRQAKGTEVHAVALVTKNGRQAPVP